MAPMWSNKGCTVGPPIDIRIQRENSILSMFFYTIIIILIHFRKKTTPARYTVLRYLRKTCVNPFIGLKGLKGLPKSPNFWKTYFGLFTLKDIIPTNVRDQPILQTQMNFQIFIFLYISLLWYFFFSLIFLLRFW